MEDIEININIGSPASRGAKLWIITDIRQGNGLFQCNKPDSPNYISAETQNGDSCEVQIYDHMRTFDLYPEVPEFTNFSEAPLIEGEQFFTIKIKSWETPKHPIDKFRFWVLVDIKGQWEVFTSFYKTYHIFIKPSDLSRVEYDNLLSSLSDISVSIQGEYTPVKVNFPDRKKYKNVFWGELHGMAFNQREFDDFYDYAKNITKLDFASAVRFSYLNCTGDVWERTKAAAKKHTVDGKFIAFTGVEFGTPPDDSHRVVYFPNPESVPPIYCEARLPALDPHFLKRQRSDTVICKNLSDFYRAIDKYNGLISGHFHTWHYDREVLCEIWQKQLVPETEEQRLYDYLKQGKKMAIVGGSDTHDSMPGNPYPEPHCPRPAGHVGVWADELTSEALFEAFRARRVFATTGTRMVVDFDSNGNRMGSILPVSSERKFRINLAATAQIDKVEFLRDGECIKTMYPNSDTFETEVEDVSNSEKAFYHIKIWQCDGHKAWSTPIWFE